MEKLLLPAIHLFGLVAFLVYKTKGSFVSFVNNRHVEVRDGLNKSKLQAAQADSKRKEVEAKFASLQKEKDLIFAEWKEKETAQIKSIKDASPKILAQMSKEAEQNKASLESQVKAQIMKKITDQIVVKVEENVKAGLNAQVHQGLSDRFVKEVSA